MYRHGRNHKGAEARESRAPDLTLLETRLSHVEVQQTEMDNRMGLLAEAVMSLLRGCRN